MTHGAIIMLAIDTSSPQLQVLTRLHQASAHALAGVLHGAGITPIIVCAPELAWWAGDRVPIVPLVDTTHPFHFGQRLAEVIHTQHLDTVYYFGAGSAPLLTAEHLHALRALLTTNERVAITNNLHSSDWVVFNHAAHALPILSTMTRDNSLAWELRETQGFTVHTFSQHYPTLHLDLDMPADFVLAAAHPACPASLRDAIRAEPMLNSLPIAEVLDILRRDGSQVVVVGRVSPLAWQALNQVTRCWIRVFAEERGMVASGRMARGEVRSLLGSFLVQVGVEAFWAELARLGDAVIMDSRVLMAHMGALPSTSERFAADLLDVEAIQTAWLRDFTQAAANAPIPVLLGGHTVVAGGLWVMADQLKPH